MMEGVTTGVQRLSRCERVSRTPATGAAAATATTTAAIAAIAAIAVTANCQTIFNFNAMYHHCQNFQHSFVPTPAKMISKFGNE